MDFWRQMDIVSPDALNRKPVTIIGAGGIGSPLTLALSKLGVDNITVYDDDSVECHNLPNQLYRLSDLGRPKVEALAEICKDFTGATVIPVPTRVTGQRLKGIVISGIDSMKGRKEIWDECVKYKPAVPVYMEARMGAEVARIHTVRPTNPDDVAWYESTLYSDEEADEQPCTARAVSYNVFALAGLMGSQLKKIVKGEPAPRELIIDLHNNLLLTQ